jgi:hypothetical protein
MSSSTKKSKKGKPLNKVTPKGRIEPLSAIVPKGTKTKTTKSPTRDTQNAQASSSASGGDLPQPEARVIPGSEFERFKSTFTQIERAPFYRMLHLDLLPLGLLDTCSVLMLASTTPRANEVVRLNKKSQTFRDEPCICGRHQTKTVTIDSTSFHARVMGSSKLVEYNELPPFVAAMNSYIRLQCMTQYFGKGLQFGIKHARTFSFLADGVEHIEYIIPEDLPFETEIIKSDDASHKQTVAVRSKWDYCNNEGVRIIALPSTITSAKISAIVGSTNFGSTNFKLILPSVSNLEISLVYANNTFSFGGGETEQITSLKIHSHYLETKFPVLSSFKNLTELHLLSARISASIFNILPMKLETLILADFIIDEKTEDIEDAYSTNTCIKHMVVSNVCFSMNNPKLVLPSSLETFSLSGDPTLFTLPPGLICYGLKIRNSTALDLGMFAHLEIFVQVDDNRMPKNTSWFTKRNGIYELKHEVSDSIETITSSNMGGMWLRSRSQIFSLPSSLRILATNATICHDQCQKLPRLEQLYCTTANFTNLLHCGPFEILSKVSLVEIDTCANNHNFLATLWQDLFSFAPKLPVFTFVLPYRDSLYEEDTTSLPTTSTVATSATSSQGKKSRNKKTKKVLDLTTRWTAYEPTPKEKTPQEKMEELRSDEMARVQHFRTSLPLPLFVDDIRVKCVVSDRCIASKEKSNHTICTSMVLENLDFTCPKFAKSRQQTIETFPGHGKVSMTDTHKQVFDHLKHSGQILRSGQRISIYHRFDVNYRDNEDSTRCKFPWIQTEHIVRVDSVDCAFNDIVYYVGNDYTSFFKFNEENGTNSMIAAYEYSKLSL